MNHALAAMLTGLCCTHTLAQTDIEIRVRDLTGAPVARSNVIVCDATTGIPVLDNGEPFTRSDPEQGSGEILFLQTDADGEARFEDLPLGSYRVIAQAWEGTPGPEELLVPNGVTVHLHGFSGVFTVNDETNEPVVLELKALGTGVLEMDLEMPNDETLVVVSARPLGADPVLGFAGWNGDFMRGMLAGNRMPAGRTRFTGLPEGEVHIGVFAADNIPGFGAATVRIEPERTARVEIPLVAMWGSAVHAPPPELQPLADKLAGMAHEQLEQIAARFRAGPDASKGPMQAMAGLAPLLDETYTFEDGEVATLGEVFAALAYTLMDRTITDQGFRPNPYRPVTVTYEDAEP